MKSAYNGYTFELSDKVTRNKVRFENRYGVELVGDLYLPKEATGKLAALVVSGPFGAVKEQSSGLYAEELAQRGFATLAFDNSFTGESGGKVRNMASPEIYTEDYSAAVDYLLTRDDIDEDRIAAVAVCGLSGMAITAATVDPRIKAVVTASMYDMSNSIARGYQNSYTLDQRLQILDHTADERTAASRKGQGRPGAHELAFDQSGNLIKNQQGLPDSLPEGPVNPVLKAFFDYYKTERGYAERSINSNTAWDSRTPYSFFAFPLYANLELLGNRKVLLIAGDQAHSYYHSEAVSKATPQAQLLTVEGADHVDLYDNKDLIPFDKIESFLKEELN